ncbi:Plasmid partitioning protein RepB [Neorhizobium galegae bv. officinalis]|uniref:Plasmid partitioning protein RepB n=1 Tax=Neorhizobium galegae bv. officinalis TaxID=323656 RepID=A0A0T7G303_NEOGA|nr:plasmid partitioning protein RepB [Neorhizobium galegae]CDZ41715.1 Plasmid partitioning protein RepB [Neorhizobium galegae bv. officinalis]
MARKNPFMNVMSEEAPDNSKAILEYTNKGASKSLIHSLDEMAAQADRFLEGETVVELDPAIIDGSFVRDRLEDDEADFDELLSAIRDRGQDTPILVRPHPSATGRYMVVFGHRRLRAAKALERKVRTVVKDLKDQDHLVAQGQENSARANLSFIEKAMFATEIARRQFDGDNAIVLSALSIDRATLSKMLAVSTIPKVVLDAVGAAKGIGRDRWYELKSLLERPSTLQKALDFIETADFKEMGSDDRFNALLAFVKTIGKQARPKAMRTHKWSSEDKAVLADIKADGKTYTFALKARDAVGFGDFIADKLGDLYQAYRNKLDQQGE